MSVEVHASTLENFGYWHIHSTVACRLVFWMCSEFPQLLTSHKVYLVLTTIRSLTIFWFLVQIRHWGFLEWWTVSVAAGRSAWEGPSRNMDSSGRSWYPGFSRTAFTAYIVVMRPADGFMGIWRTVQVFIFQQLIRQCCPQDRIHLFRFAYGKIVLKT